MRRLDAIAQTDGVGRMEWLMRLAEPEFERRIHGAIGLCRMLDINPNESVRGVE